MIVAISIDDVPAIGIEAGHLAVDPDHAVAAASRSSRGSPSCAYCLLVVGQRVRRLLDESGLSTVRAASSA